MVLQIVGYKEVQILSFADRGIRTKISPIYQIQSLMTKDTLGNLGIWKKRCDILNLTKGMPLNEPIDCIYNVYFSSQ